MFIVIDWIDWSWKETQVKLLEKKLILLWKKVLVLDYPRYDNESSFFVRKHLNWKYKDLSAKQEAIFFAVDRFDDYKNYKEKLKEYDYVIANRYVSSSMFHWWCKIEDEDNLDEYINWLENLEYNIFCIPKPDKTFFLNLSLNKSLELIEKRWRKKDINEWNFEHLKKAHLLANKLVRKKKWIDIRCEKDWILKSIEDINIEILNKIL